MSAGSSGAANGLQLSDLSGGVLNALHVLSGAATVRSPITNGAASFAYTSATASVGSLAAITGAAAGTFSINGGSSISVDLNTDSLQSIANKINAAGGGITATVQSSIVSGKTTYQLQITGGSTPTFSDPNNILGSIGVVQQGLGNQLIAAKDANYSLDGVNLTSASNTITSAIPGSTLTLLKGTVATPGTSNLTLTTDTTGINTKVQSFITAYNASSDFITQNSQYDPSSKQSGLLFGDFTTQQVQSGISQMLFNNVPGLTGSYKNLASLGFTLSQTGDISLDQSVFDQAMSSNPSAVQAIFASSGSTSSSTLSYVSSTNKTVSGGNPYAVNITQLATQGAYTGEQAQTTANPTSETLTFNGSLFGSTPYNLSLDVNSTVDTTVAKINADSTLKNLVAASNAGGFLKLTSRRYGNAGNFTAVSNQTAAANNSGIGTGSLGAKISGVDVAGTINGEPATGNGQFLSGNTSNAKTEGLQIQYTGTTLGAAGSVTFSKGIAAQISDQVNSYTDPSNGLIVTDTNSLQSQVDDMTAQITTLRTQLGLKQKALQLQFANMETALAQLQNQQQQLSSFTNSLNASSTTTTAKH